MGKYVDLGRRFRDFTESELSEPDLLVAFNELDSPRSSSWSELIRSRRVLLLAEAGSGKTEEMRQQAARLVADNQKAFFVALEALDENDLATLLSADQERTLRAWRDDPSSRAWFFLDAVDELKLRQGKLINALRRFAKSIDGLLHRAHVVISSRPSDWRHVVDMATFNDVLPIAPVHADALLHKDDAFLAALRTSQRMVTTDDNRDATKDIRTVVMLPLSNNQVRKLTTSLGIDDAESLVAEIDRQQAWIFARRPLDLSELVETWKSSGRLGTRAEQHESNIAGKLKDDPDRPDRGLLANARAREGAERLALALSLSRHRTLRSPERALGSDSSDALDPVAILYDWDEDERQALLRRALFDPATYGSIRFHHRSALEYLAASRLRDLRRMGMRTTALLRLLFAERYGVQVAVPSMRPIAAWLALWNDDVRRELMQREPETLLSMGDPESLSLPARIALVRAFVRKYREGGWRGFDLPVEEVRRLAHPELSDVIRDAWTTGAPNDEVRQFLLVLIWQGAMDRCLDLAEEVARTPEEPAHHRVIAIRALVACGRTTVLRRLVESMVQKPEQWPARVLWSVANDLFPTNLSVSELMLLLERTTEPKGTTSGFGWNLRYVAQAVEPWSQTAVELRDRLSDLVWKGRHAAQEWHRIQGAHDYLTPALAILCERQLSTRPASADHQLIRASVVANRFGSIEGLRADVHRKLLGHFRDGSPLREAAFWIELALMDALASARDAWHRLYQANHEGLLGGLVQEDRGWLETAVADKSSGSSNRVIALHALLQLWLERGRPEVDAESLRSAVADNSALADVAAKYTAPREPDPEAARIERAHAKRHALEGLREKKRLEQWLKWRDELIANPATAFDSDNHATTIANIYKWLEARHAKRDQYTLWDRAAIAEAFGETIALRTERALSAWWRSHPPTLWSNKPIAERNSVRWDWIYGLCGIAVDAGSPMWTSRLRSDEARQAVAYATIELNGFPRWLADLAEIWPNETRAVLSEELLAQLAIGPESAHLPLLQDLTHSEHKVKQLVAPACAEALRSWAPSFPEEESSNRSAYHLDQAIRLACEARGDIERAVAAECRDRYLDSPDGPLAVTWLRGLFRCDPTAGLHALDASAPATAGPEAQRRAVAILAALFGERERVLLEFPDAASRALALGRLIRYAYRNVRPEDDQQHEGAYTPNQRDRAEDARHFLLSALLETPGGTARAVLVELSEDPLFAHIPDRLRFLARERAAQDAEFDPYAPSDIVALDVQFENPPHDRDTLFKVMQDRLDDLSHDIAHDDFTDRITLRTIRDEPEMQRYLARRLRDMAKGAYTVVRENEVADRKRTDIRLTATRGEATATIEVKIADERWSLTQLEDALRNQLVGQYLRYRTGKAGCLLLTYDGNRVSWRHPSSNAALSFSEAVAYLNGVAADIEQDDAVQVRVYVHALDLRDPILIPAKK